MRTLSVVLTTLLFCLAPLVASAQLEVSAGEDVVLEYTSDDGVRYTLNGRVAGDADVEWSTDPEIRLDGRNTLTPTGLFPVGETIATLHAQRRRFRCARA